MNAKNNPKPKNRRKIPADYYIFSQNVGFLRLGPEVTNTKAKTIWECSQKHRWEARYNCIQKGDGCPLCYNAKRNQGTIIPQSGYHALANKRGLKWLGPEVKSTHDNTLWECSKAHKWESQYANIRQGSGCPHCAGISPKISIDYHDLAQSKGFRWLGPVVINSKTKTTWQCPKDHEWQSTFSSIQSGYGCSVCQESRGEAETAKILEVLDILYGRQKRFQDCRGKKYPLPFDFYFPLNGKHFLVEYQGERHYHAKSYFGGKQALHAIQHRDAIKAEYAKDNGYHLILIPYTELENIEYIIQSEVKND